jgi:hypothetical protein
MRLLRTLLGGSRSADSDTDDASEQCPACGRPIINGEVPPGYESDPDSVHCMQCVVAIEGRHSFHRAEDLREVR